MARTLNQGKKKSMVYLMALCNSHISLPNCNGHIQTGAEAEYIPRSQEWP